MTKQREKEHTQHNWRRRLLLTLPLCHRLPLGKLQVETGFPFPTYHVELQDSNHSLYSCSNTGSQQMAKFKNPAQINLRYSAWF